MIMIYGYLDDIFLADITYHRSKLPMVINKTQKESHQVLKV